MKAILQRVAHASLTIDGRRHASIGRGMVALIGIERDDAPADRALMVDRLLNLRFFPDAAGKLNLSIADVRGEILLVPNFTLAGDCRRGRRPSFDAAMPPDEARVEFDSLVRDLSGATSLRIASGCFGADMLVELANDGPVTLIVQTGAATA